MSETQNLNSLDILLLSYLYKYRALSIEMGWFAVYRTAYPDFSSCYRSRILPLIQSGIITYKPHPKHTYILLLTPLGQDVLRQSQNLPRYIDNRRTLLKPSEIAIDDAQIPHQVALSDFMIKFSDLYRRKQYSEELQVYVETAVEKYDYMRPDGMLLLSDLRIFVEQDMGTESRFMLSSKWGRYRRYLSSIKNENTSPIIVPFIIDTAPGSFTTRCDVIRRTAEVLFSHMLDRQIEIFIGSEDELLKTMFQVVLKDHFHEPTVASQIPSVFSQEGYRVVPGESIAKYTGNTFFSWFVQRTVNGKIQPLQLQGNQGNTKIPDLFVVDSFEGYPLSVIAKIMFLERSQSYFSVHFKQIKRLQYLVVGKSKDDLEVLRHQLVSVGFKGGLEVYFTVLGAGEVVRVGV